MKFKQKRDSSRLFAAASVAAMALSSTSALAQQAPAEPQYDDEAIVVIGVTKQAMNIQDVPISITAFSGEKLEDQGIREVGEIAKFTPGFNIRGSGNNPTAFALSMRGQVQNDNLATLEPSVGIYLDDIYVARAYGLNVDMLDVGNVQVLKGPQGTLFGRNTSAGAILIQTADPILGELSGRLSATYGRFNERSATGIVNVPLGDNLAVRGALSYGKRDGYKVDVRTGRKYEARETLNGRVKLAYEPTENLSILLSGEWYDGDIVGQARQNLFYRLAPGVDPAAPDRALFGGDPDKVAITDPALVPGTPPQGLFNSTKTQTYIAKVTLESDIGQFKWISGYRHVSGANLLDLDGSSQVLGNHYTAGSQDLSQYSTELQLTGTTASKAFDYALGLTYFKEYGNDVSRSTTNGSASWSGFDGDIDNDSFGLYAQATWHATEKLGVTGGLRYSIDDKGVTTQSAVFANNGTVPSVCLPTTFMFDKVLAGTLVASDCNRSRRDSFKNLSYTIGLDYQLTDDILVYVKQSKGYRSGAQQLRSLTLFDTAPAQPEIVNEQELGIKTELFDGRVRFNVAGYHNKVSNAQRSVILSVAGVQQTILENASTETWGGEADLNVRVTEGIDLFASGSITDPKYTSYSGFSVVGGALTPDDKSDTNFVAIVKKQFVVGANVNQDIGFARFKANISYAWQDKMFQDPINFARLTRPANQLGGSGFTPAEADAALAALTTRAHGITNARASLAFGPNDNYEIAVWGRNIFDERATMYTLFLGGLNYVGTSWNDPATYGVTASVKF